MTSHRIATRRELPTLSDFKIEAENVRQSPKKPSAGRRPRVVQETPAVANDTALPDAAD